MGMVTGLADYSTSRVGAMDSFHSCTVSTRSHPKADIVEYVMDGGVSEFCLI